MLCGARTALPVALSKTWNPSFTIWTYWVAPTAPLGSGGAQLQPTPGNGIPLKLRMVAGTFGASRLSVETWLFWMTGSGVSWCRYGTFGFSFASCSAFKSDAFHRGILRSGGEISFLYEAPTVRPLDCWFAFGACADNDPAENKPSPTSASKTAIEQRTKPSRMRGLKKADSDADFFFMGRFCSL